MWTAISRPLLAVLLCAASTAPAAAPSPLDGDWKGTLAPPGGGTLRLALHFARGDDGALVATLDSLDQDAMARAESVKVDGRRVAVVFASPPAIFAGALDEAGRELRGEWRESSAALPITFRRTGDAGPPPELWEGKLLLPGGVGLRLLLRVTRLPGGLRAVLDSLDQGALGIPVDSVSLDGGELRFSSSKVGASFRGKLEPDGDRAVGQFEQRGASLPLTLQRTARVSRLARPQTPQPPFPYRAEEVTFENAAAQVTLAGTLVIPEGKRRFPAVLLITGSGPQDRDESMLGHKPFWVLADVLARRGIAVLRVDDRGVGASTGNFSTSTTQDFAGDAAAGLAFLKTRAELDPKHLGLLGHSEGGLVAALVASEQKGVGFVVLLASPGVPGDQVILDQGDFAGRAAGRSEAEVAAARERQQRLFELVKSTPDPAVLAARARPLLEASLAALPSPEQQAAGDRAARVEGLLAQLGSPWLRFFVAFDPRPVFAKVSCPVLALGGEKDAQVPAKQNLAAIAAALAAGGNRDVTTRALPGLNHLFQTAQTGAPTEYGALEETMAPAVLSRIGDWILAHARR